MPRPHTIMRLPSEIRAEIDRFLAQQGRSVDEFAEFLATQLGPLGVTVSRSAAHRYMQGYEVAAASLRRSREVTEALSRHLPEAELQGRQGRLLVEMVRTVVFDLLVKIQEGGIDEIGTKDVQQLGKGLAELARALRLDQDFEIKIREEERKALAAAVDARLNQAEADLGGDAPQDPAAVLRRIREDVYGIFAP